MRIFFLCLTFVVQQCLSCENIAPNLCPKEGAPSRCSRINGNGVLCCNIDSDYRLKEGINFANVDRNDTLNVVIYNSTLENIDASSKSWTHLQSLTWTNSKLKKVNGRFRGSLKCVNFSNNALIDIDKKAFENLSKLQSLYLSNNNLTKLPNLNLGRNNLTLDISGNPELLCHSVTDLLEQQNSNILNFKNHNTSSCKTSSYYHWFNTTSVIPFSQFLQQDCPKGDNYRCNCSTARTDFPPGKPPIVSVQVNCSGQHLTELPIKLPDNTISLEVSNNNITTLDPLVYNPTYQYVRWFNADNNRIESISSLEGSSFIDNFVLLSLKGNKLKSIPTYLLSNTFDRTWGEKHVKLGRNKLHCDCSTAQVIKIWLIANKHHVLDYDEVLCDKDLEKVINLDQKIVCVYQKDWTDYIYYIIAAEIMLLLLLISKVSYDYWIFKTSGYLPWPASKMPKLPCDWVFEA